MTSLAQPRKDLVLASFSDQSGHHKLVPVVYAPTLLIALEEDGASQPLWLGSSHLIWAIVVCDRAQWLMILKSAIVK